jgi:hypothetical protein
VRITTQGNGEVSRKIMITKHLQILAIVAVLSLFAFFINLLQRRMMDFKYCIVWLFSLLGVLLFSIWPSLINRLANLLGIYDSVNALFLICIFFLVCICISLTVVVSLHSNRIRTLTQNLAIKEQENKKETLESTLPKTQSNQDIQ